MKEVLEKLQTSRNVVLLLLAPYFTCLSLIYLLGYWGSFSINPLQYISFADVLNYSLPSIIGGVVIWLMSGLAGNWIVDRVSPLRDFPKVEDWKSKLHSLARKEDKDAFLTSLEQRLSKVSTEMKFFGYFLLVVGSTFSIMFKVSYYFFWAIGCFLASWMESYFFKMHVLRDFIENSQRRRIVLFLLSFMPIASFINGVRDGTDICTNVSFWYSKSSELPSDFNLVKDSSLKYVGKLGKYIFFISNDNKTSYMSDDSKINPLILHKH